MAFVKKILFCTILFVFFSVIPAAKSQQIDMDLIVEFASYWLNADCKTADFWCSGHDTDRDSYVDLKDFTNSKDLWYRSIEFEFSSDKIVVKNRGETIEVSLKRPIINVDGTNIPAVNPQSISGVLQSGNVIEVAYPSYTLSTSASVDVKLFLQWSDEESILRKWADVRLNKTSGTGILYDVELDRIYTHGQAAEILTENYWWMTGQSYPVFINSFFLGVEFPVAKTRIEGDYIILAHRPGLEMSANQWYETQKAVYGLTYSGKEKDSFKKYISSISTASDQLHVNYNSWWTYTNSNPYTENDILNLMDEFKNNLFNPFGVTLDTFCLDLGWSNPQSIWQYDTSLFPEGFTNIDIKAKSMNSNLGLWLSPSVFYAPALDTNWAYQNGYEVNFWFGPNNPGFMCVGGPNYKNLMTDQMVNYTNTYDEKHFKIDGFWLTCNETDHGHLPGDYSVEHIAQDGIDFFDELHMASSETWIETTCFGWNASPWWLRHCDSVIGVFGDDCPSGRVPCPTYRESYTTGRDYFNLQGAALLATPIHLQEVLGVVHQSNQPLINDAVTVLMRGHQFMPLYINPAYMNSTRWLQIADIISWGRQNWSVLKNTQTLLPVEWQNGQVPRLTPEEQMPRTPYGYAHWSDTQNIIGLRNPWVKMQSYTIALDEKIGFDPADTNMSAVSLYPEIRIYGQDLSYGDNLEVPMAPYETLVLSVTSNHNLGGLENVDNIIGQDVSVTINNQSVGANYELDLQAQIISSAPQTKFFMILEDASSTPPSPSYSLKINNVNKTFYSHSSDDGFVAAGIGAEERWRILEIDLSSGTSNIDLQLPSGADCEDMSLWVWTSKAGGTKPSYANAIISPEKISLSSLPVGSTDRTVANTPQPEDGELAVVTNPTLRWNAGSGAQSHEIYLGTSFAAVENANTSSPEHKATLSASQTYYYTGQLDNETTYYWRVDENADGITYKGMVWQFKTRGNPVDPALVGWWKFDETNGSIAHDSSGYGYDAQVVNGANWSAGNGLLFDGLNDYVDVPHQVLDNLSTQVTVCLWQYGTDSGYPIQNSIFRAPYLLNVHMPFEGGGYDGPNPVFWDAGYPSERIYKSAAQSDILNNWNHWVFIKNTSTGIQQIYLNGQLFHSDSGKVNQFSNGSSDFYIGTYAPGLFPYKGYIDDFRLYKRQLSPTEISDVFNSGR
jgi:hypothetical protein